MLQSDCNGFPMVQFSLYFSAKKFFTSDRLAHSSEDVPRYHILLEPAHTIFAQACLGVLLRSDDRVNETHLVKYGISCRQTALNKLGVGLVPSINDRQVVGNVRTTKGYMTHSQSFASLGRFYVAEHWQNTSLASIRSIQMQRMV
jgi:hypothetical protein